MDSANKQSAVIAESVVGTIPANPAFLLLRDTRINGAPQRASTRSPERRADRMAANLVTGLNSYPKSIDLPWTRDAGLDVLWSSLFCNDFAPAATSPAAPVQSAPATSTAGGTLAANTYYYVVSQTVGGVESRVSNEQSITTTGATSSNTINFTGVAANGTPKIYRGTAAGAENLYYTGTVGATSFVDTGAAGTTATPPAANTLKNASNLRSFTLEEKYGGQAIYRRLSGVFCDTVQIAFTNGQPGSLAFGLKALGETAASSALAGATYASPTPGNDPSPPAEITVNNLFGITTPAVMSMNMTITNTMREQYKWGSADPFGIGLGLFDVQGTVQLYFSALTQYQTFMTRQKGLTLDLTVGSAANQKDEIVLSNVDVWNPNVDDPGATGDHMVTLSFMGRYYATDSSAIKLIRNVA